MAAGIFIALENSHNTITLPPAFAESLYIDGKHPVPVHCCNNVNYPDLVLVLFFACLTTYKLPQIYLTCKYCGLEPNNTGALQLQYQVTFNAVCIKKH